MKWLFGAVLGGLVLSATASAAPRAESALECGIAADMAVVAHSLAREQVQPPKAGAIMSRIYDVAGSDRGKTLMKDILDAAYSHNGGSSQKFAEDLFAACMKGGGNMDPVLGQKL
jgi:lipopolysaccharide export LptBFGC system permease protein LptF